MASNQSNLPGTFVVVYAGIGAIVITHQPNVANCRVHAGPGEEQRLKYLRASLKHAWPNVQDMSKAAKA
jgi:hypothetical protein